mgnify:CR=1 FL=1
MFLHLLNAEFAPLITLYNTADASKLVKKDFNLLWNPDITIENGQANIEFFTADDLAHYHVFVEGISKSGKICLGTGLITVSIPRR